MASALKLDQGMIDRINQMAGEHPDWSNRKIAKELGLHNTSVARYRATPAQPTAKVGAPSASIDEQNIHLRAKNSQLESLITQMRGELGSRKEMAAAVREAVTATDPFPRVPWKTPAKPGSSIEPVFVLSDWQIGEVIDPDKTEGFGEFNWEIAQRRIFGMTEAFLAWVELQRHVYRIDRIRIFLAGDPISGDIHPELQFTNEFPIPVQSAKAGLLTGEVISRIAPHAAEVIVEGIDADNHGRMTKKNQWKEGGLNNMAHLVNVLAGECVSKHGNVDFRAGTGRIKDLFDVCGKKFLVEHGHAVKAWMGIPYYGLERARAREAVRRMNTELGFHYQVCGHWHVAGWFAGTMLVNGNLPGTTEFDHACGRHAPPAQVAFLVHPKHGVFNFTPFTVI